MIKRHPQESAIYPTIDTGFAAFLVTSGIKLFKMDMSNPKVKYLFEQDGKADITDLKFQWDSGMAVGNVPIFFKTYRSFIRQIKEKNG